MWEGAERGGGGGPLPRREPLGRPCRPVCRCGSSPGGRGPAAPVDAPLPSGGAGADPVTPPLRSTRAKRGRGWIEGGGVGAGRGASLTGAARLAARPLGGLDHGHSEAPRRDE